MSVLVVSDQIVHYEVLGRGPAVLLLHGCLGSWRYWVPTMQTLSARYRTYAFDLWGHGDTAHLVEPYTLDLQAALLKEFLDQLGIARIALIGHNVGAAVALRFTRQNPDYVARLITVGMPLAGPTLNPRLLSSTPITLFEWVSSRFAGLEELATEVQKTDPSAYLGLLQSIQATDLRYDLSHLHVPCLLAHGERDPLVTAPQSTWLTGLDFANVFRLIIPEGLHFPMIDDPPKFQRLLLDALDKNTELASLTLKEEWKRRLR
jgi:pimeloyl-ACP methyl ester carboxylesterase